MHRHCGINKRAPWWTFTDPCKPEVRPGAREESASPAWLAAPAMNARTLMFANTHYNTHFNIQVINQTSIVTKVLIITVFCIMLMACLAYICFLHNFISLYENIL